MPAVSTLLLFQAQQVERVASFWWFDIYRGYLRVFFFRVYVFIFISGRSHSGCHPQTPTANRGSCICKWHPKLPRAPYPFVSVCVGVCRGTICLCSPLGSNLNFSPFCSGEFERGEVGVDNSPLPLVQVQWVVAGVAVHLQWLPRSVQSFITVRARHVGWQAKMQKRKRNRTKKTDKLQLWPQRAFVALQLNSHCKPIYIPPPRSIPQTPVEAIENTVGLLPSCTWLSKAETQSRTVSLRKIFLNVSLNPGLCFCTSSHVLRPGEGRLCRRGSVPCPITRGRYRANTPVIYH